MSTFARPIAKCIVRWIYEQASWVLEQLKNFLLYIISIIDAYIAILRAWLIQWDILAQLEQAAWELIESFLNEILSQLRAFPEGPAGDICPEFAAWFTDPIVGLIESFLRSLTFAHEDLNSTLSYIDEIDQLIAYWENTKLDLLVAIDVIDAALYEALMNEAENVP